MIASIVMLDLSSTLVVTPSVKWALLLLELAVCQSRVIKYKFLFFLDYVFLFYVICLERFFFLV